jgi:hypothetical protein
MKRLLIMPLVTLALVAPAAPDPVEAGPQIIAEAFGRLSAALGEAITNGGPASAMSVCSEKAPQIAQEVSAVHGVTLRRATAKPRNPKNAADEVEKTALEAFMVALAQKETPKPQLISNADGSTSFLAPIVLGNPLCLKCHGTPNQDVDAATLAAIQKQYPDDKATGYKLGDLRGLWRVTFPASPQR